jgi:hypothetical protein
LAQKNIEKGSCQNIVHYTKTAKMAEKKQMALKYTKTAAKIPNVN